MQKREIGLKGVRLRKAEEGDGRTVEGLAVPFNRTIDTWDSGPETFDPDCVFDGLDEAKLCYQHGELIGTITNAESRDDGLHIQARIADTETGRDVVALLDEGALDSLSVGFVPEESEKDRDGITHRKKVRLMETSLVSWPAYQDAKLTDHRSEEQSKEENPQPTKEREQEMPTNEQFEKILGRLDAQDETLRKLQAMPSKSKPAVFGSEFRSSGEFLKALATGDERAADLYGRMQKRDWNGATIGVGTGDDGNPINDDTDSQAVWVAGLVRILTIKRRITNLIDHKALPSEGMKLDYNVLTSDTTKTGEQTKEGEKLPYGKITLGDKSAKVLTYGGYTSISRQTIERSTTDYLSFLMTALVNSYAKNSEQGSRDALYGAIKDVDAGDMLTINKGLAGVKPNDWIGMFVDASEEFDERNASLEYLGVSSDVFKAIACLTDNGDRFMNVSGSGVNQLGTIDIKGITGDLLHLPVQLMPNATPGTACFLDHTAVTMWESPNAPFRLQQDNILNLTRDYSVYGYAAHGTTFPDGLLPIKFADSGSTQSHSSEPAEESEEQA
ncbi:HK97 family phage prohead protease [Bifidobacterium sp. ESL0769]|uniref:HK97 family phage prohead protease n=1 Tax=Bifidobacterium sp. ESL0769 TaxID=2983229 RepID=UPI0023F64301|nr:HK97 family phage prohead protease [Bifidobacterium sp. ESL0769]WEV67965.1 HK97 family phage prohead protease [Bifidobacterium sp. ESL0769]